MNVSRGSWPCSILRRLNSQSPVRSGRVSTLASMAARNSSNVSALPVGMRSRRSRTRYFSAISFSMIWARVRRARPFSFIASARSSSRRLAGAFHGREQCRSVYEVAAWSAPRRPRDRRPRRAAAGRRAGERRQVRGLGGFRLWSVVVAPGASVDCEPAGLAMTLPSVLKVKSPTLLRRVVTSTLPPGRTPPRTGGRSCRRSSLVVVQLLLEVGRRMIAKWSETWRC